MIRISESPILRIMVRFFSAFILLYCASLFKVTCVVGASSAFFSGTSILGPLTGTFMGLGGLAIYHVLKSAGAYFLSGITLLPFLVYHIPGFCASASWASASPLVWLGVPCACGALFLVHPVGCAAWAMVFFWLIPLVAWFCGRNNLWGKALGSTFIAHAVGTILWLYTRQTTAAFWWHLMPIVVIERLLYASGMVAVMLGVKEIKSLYQGGFKVILSASSIFNRRRI